MRPYDRRRNRYRWLTAAGLSLILAAFALLGLSFTGVIGGGSNSMPEPSITPAPSDATTSTGFSLGEDSERLRRLGESWRTSGAAPEDTVPLVVIPPARLVIPKIQVDAPVVTLGVDGEGIMQSPAGPFEVGWYDFSGQPGMGSNAVFSGHVDYASVGPAVFWELRELTLGDVVEVSLADGTVYSYVVVSTAAYDAGDAPITEIVGPTAKDTVTIITCTGTFNYDVHQYSHRLVVRAERL